MSAINAQGTGDNVANDFFAPFIGMRPSYMQNTPTGSGAAANIGAVAPLVGAALIGPEGDLEDLGVGIDEVVTKASSAVGGQSVKVASEDVAKQAADRFVGPGAKPLYDRNAPGIVRGWESADGTRRVLGPHIDAMGSHYNLVNTLTHSNLHVRW